MEYLTKNSTVNDVVPKVSVCIQAYNHVHYIRQCLDSILTQVTDFSYEIILGEDESSDGTRHLCLEYADRFPDKIRLFLRSRKDVIYVNGAATGRYNFLENLKTARGKYIALCDGDDFWTDSLKLQKQASYLDQHIRCSAVFTDNIGVDRSGKFIKEQRRVPPGIKSIETSLLLQGNVIHTSSFMFRADILTDKVIRFVRPMPYGDMAIFLAASTFGPIRHIPDLTSAYRRHVGVTKTIGNTQKILNSIQIRSTFIEEFDESGEYEQYFRVGKRYYLLKLSISYFLDGKLLDGVSAYLSFWWHTIYRPYPPIPLLNRLSLLDHIRPVWHLLKASIRVAKL